MWNISDKRRKKRIADHAVNNMGMTLVELLVAFAVSAIVLTGLSYIIFSVLQFYGRANANVEIQNESQTALNLVMDSVIAAKGVCFIEQDASAIDPTTDEMTCALFGDLVIDDTTTVMTFTGDAVMWQPKSQEMYLMSGTFDLGTYTDAATAPIEAIEAMKTKLPAAGDARLPYLMAQNVTAFELTADSSCFVPKSNKAESEMTEEEKKKSKKNYFENPLIIHINMEFEYQYQTGKVVTRQMDDKVSVRNRLDQIYIQRSGKSMLKYLRNPD